MIDKIKPMPDKEQFEAERKARNEREALEAQSRKEDAARLGNEAVQRGMEQGIISPDTEMVDPSAPDPEMPTYGAASKGASTKIGGPNSPGRTAEDMTRGEA